MSELEDKITKIFDEAKYKALALIVESDTPAPAVQEKTSAEVEKPLTAPQLAEVLGISETQVRTLERDGKIPSHRLGGLVKYYLSEVKAATLNNKPKLKIAR